MQNSNTKKLVTTAIMIALGTAIAVICDLIPFLNPPLGGTITICSMLPLVLVAWMYGTKWGLKAGLVYGILQMLTGYSTVSGLFTPDENGIWLIKAILIVAIDYILAYTAMGLGGIFANRMKKTPALVCGALVALSVRYLMHIISGAIFYGSYAEWFFTETVIADTAFASWIMSTFKGASLAIVYSVVYNGCYMIPEIIITAIGAAAISKLPVVNRQ